MVKTVKKYVVAILSLVFLLSCGIIFGNFNKKAEVKADGVSAQIKYCNIAMEDNVYILYAAEIKNNINAPELLIWKNTDGVYTEGNVTDRLSVYSKEKIEGLGDTEYYVFVYTKLSAKQMTEDVYAKIKVDGVYSELVKYSILQYAKNMKGKVSEKFDNLLDSMLTYGANAQIYKDYNLDRLANATYYELNVVGGTLSDGTNKGLFTSDNEIRITAPSEKDGQAFSCWKDGSGAEIDDKNETTIKISKSETITAVYEENYINPTFVVDNVNASAGDTDVVVTVSLKNNPGVASIVVSIAYSSDLTLTGVVFNSAYGGNAMPSNFQKTGSPVKLTWTTMDFSDLNDIFATLTFSVSSQALGKYALTLTYDEDDVYDKEYENVYFDIVSGSITVS